MKPSILPRGVALLFSVGDRNKTKGDENTAHRTDRMVGENSNDRFKKELLNNWISNTSPIVFEKGDDYYVTDEIFNAYFRRI